MRLHEWLAREGRSGIWLAAETKRLDPQGVGVGERTIQLAARRSGSIGQGRKIALVMAATRGEVGFLDLLPQPFRRAIERRLNGA